MQISHSLKYCRSLSPKRWRQYPCLRGMHCGSQQYTSNSNNCSADYLVIHLGVAVGTVLSAEKLENAAKRLVHAWPILGGQDIYEGDSSFIHTNY